METYVLSAGKSLKEIIKNLLDESSSESADYVSKRIRVHSGFSFSYKLSEEDFKIPEELYDEKIELPEYDYVTDNKMCLELAKILLNQIDNEDKIELSSSQIETILVNRKNHTLNKKVFYALCDLHADMTGVDISNTYIHGFDFRGLRNLTIDLDKVMEKDLINTNFNGVTLKGSLDDCKLYYTRFSGSENELKLDPQKIKYKSMMCTDLAGIEIVGSFDGVKIDECKFTHATGNIVINPQTLPEKRLKGLILNGVYVEPNFKGCIIDDCDFSDTKNKIIINLDDLVYQEKGILNDSWENENIRTKLCFCNLSGVTLTGDVKEKNLSTDVYGCYISRSTRPNKSATIDEYKAYMNSEYSNIWDVDIDLKDEESYNNQGINVQINIVEKKKEKHLVSIGHSTENKEKTKFKKLIEVIGSQFKRR